MWIGPLGAWGNGRGLAGRCPASREAPGERPGALAGLSKQSGRKWWTSVLLELLLVGLDCARLALLRGGSLPSTRPVVQDDGNSNKLSQMTPCYSSPVYE